MVPKSVIDVSIIWLNDDIYSRNTWFPTTDVQTQNIGKLRYANRRTPTECRHTVATQATEYQRWRDVGCRSRRCRPMPTLGQRRNASWDYSPPVLVRISKLGQEMHFSTVKMPVNLGLDWPWTSPSFLIPKLIFLHCGGVHWDCETVPGLFQFCSGTVSQSLHQCTWGMHSQSGMGPLMLECLIWIKQNRHLDCFTVWLFHNTTMLCYILI